MAALDVDFGQGDETFSFLLSVRCYINDTFRRGQDSVGSTFSSRMRPSEHAQPTEVTC